MNQTDNSNFFSVKDDEKVEAIKKKLEENDIGYTYNRY